MGLLHSARNDNFFDGNYEVSHEVFETLHMPERPPKPPEHEPAHPHGPSGPSEGLHLAGKDPLEWFRSRCPTCLRPLPCPTHDERLREALLTPPDPKPSFEDMERVEIGEYGTHIWTSLLLGDGSILLGGLGGRILRVDPSKPEGQREQELGNYGNDIVTSLLLGDGSILLGGGGGRIQRWAIPPEKIEAWISRQIAPPEIPPMPE